jgi:hypothetical protein
MQHIRLDDLVAWVRAFLLTREYQGLDAALQEPLLILAALIFAGGAYYQMTNTNKRAPDWLATQ